MILAQFNLKTAYPPYEQEVWHYKMALPETCPYSELFWSTFFRIRTEFGEILCIFPYSVRMRENTDQNNSEYGKILRSKVVNEILGRGHFFNKTNWNRAPN